MKHLCFNENWTCSAYGKTFAVTLPHDAMIGAPRAEESSTGPDLGFFTAGRAVYRKKFPKPEDAERVLLSFDGVMGLCEVNLNGQHVAFHPYGYTAFFCDLTPWLTDGENELVVTANNTAQVASRWYTGLGIYRGVEMLTSSGDRIV
ncbi:MAG: glycoside hydrolase family 2, partial [Clostridia bacterium]|nr:glycoside hydrolase family 2 [Clostridia bacterium]